MDSSSTLLRSRSKADRVSEMLHESHMEGGHFPHDPSMTEAFAPLYAADPVVPETGSLKAVVIGGGTGAPVSIRTLLSMGVETSAVVAMADDGGSTGILRERAGVTPPGDIRKCICAMAADPEDPLTRAFKYRFPFADNHTLGNLMLSALEDATGEFPQAVQICERLRACVPFNARSRVVGRARARWALYRGPGGCLSFAYGACTRAVARSG